MANRLATTACSALLLFTCAYSTPTASAQRVQPAPTTQADPAAPTTQRGATVSRVPTATTAAPVPTPPAAQRPDGTIDFSNLDWYSIGGGIVVFLVLLGILGYVWNHTRNKTLQKLGSLNDEPIFTLDELRQLRDKGQLSQEEFLRARAIVVEKERERYAKGEQEKDSGDADK